MRAVFIIALLSLVISFAACVKLELSKSGTNSDGQGCAICVFALTEVSVQVKKGSKDIAKLLSQFCNVFSNEKLKNVCADLVIRFGSDFIKWLLKKEEPDWICSKLRICKKCHLTYDNEKYYSMERSERAVLRMDDPKIHESQLRSRVFSSIFEAQFITKQFSNQQASNKLTYPNIPPKVDLDKDSFSSVHLCHRGADWRGKDCNDLMSSVHPGVSEDKQVVSDNNCNGIYGKDETGKNYEEKWCKSHSTDRTLVFFGDSATAFSIPVQWIDLNLTQVFPALVNELDWPSKSFASGWSDDISQRSVYYKFRNQNRCAHRQFVNVAFNGAQMSDFVDQIDDVGFNANWKPIMAFAGYIGNDICHKTLAEMTTPDAFRAQLLAGLEKLNSKVAPGSKVVLWGLVDGRILYNHLHNLTHPIGNGVTYDQFYSFLTCTGMNPCGTWLTRDAATRDAASKRAMELDTVVEDVVNKYKNHYSNLELAFLDFAEMLQDGFDILEKQGLPTHELIDDVDGFHPSIDVGHRILGDVIFQHLQERYPHFVGEVNPNNDAIQKKFGDQGGY